MRSGVWLWALVALALTPSCSGGYPLPPTRCDDWCDATKGQMCEYYSPASCVSQCEQQDFDLPACASQFDAVLHCFKTTPGAAADQCVYHPYNPNDVNNPYAKTLCQDQNYALSDCVALNLYGSQSGQSPPLPDL